MNYGPGRIWWRGEHARLKKWRRCSPACIPGGHWPRKGVCMGMCGPDMKIFFSRLSCSSQGSHFKSISSKKISSQDPLLRKFGIFSCYSLVFVKHSILGNWPKYERRRQEKNRARSASASAEGARVRRRRKASTASLSPEAQEIPRSGIETNSQFLALNSCNVHTSWISCSFLVCDTD